MSQPLRDLRNLLAGVSSVTGRVVSVSGTTVKVATSRGIIEAVASGSLGVGDIVTIKSGLATRTQEAATTAPVFFV